MVFSILLLLRLFFLLPTFGDSFIKIKEVDLLWNQNSESHVKYSSSFNYSIKIFSRHLFSTYYVPDNLLNTNDTFWHMILPPFLLKIQNSTRQELLQISTPSYLNLHLTLLSFLVSEDRAHPLPGLLIPSVAFLHQ